MCVLKKKQTNNLFFQKNLLTLPSHMGRIIHREVTFQDQLFQEYQAGYHKGYEHGIHDASELTAEDIKLISDLEFYELNNDEDPGKTLEEIRKKVAEKFNDERTKARVKTKEDMAKYQNNI